jgi:enoyl-CoA hydratase
MSSSPILENLLYEKKGAIAFVRLNRPKVLNALNQQTWKELRTVFEDARDDPEIRGVILTGAGDKAFIAGADIGELAHVTAVEAEQSSSYGQAVLDLIENLGKPVIAAVNGYALGGGCETAMACTIRVAAEQSGRRSFTDTELEQDAPRPSGPATDHGDSK